MKIKNQLTLILITTLMISCGKSENQEIEVELRSYFDLFQSEAELRGLEIDIEAIDISGYIESINERGILGQCKSYSNGSKSVVIDEDYWNQADDYEREYIVFHELGHCALGRDHNNDADNSGTCQSIMQSGDEECKNEYDQNNRAQLLDELFYY